MVGQGVGLGGVGLGDGARVVGSGEEHSSLAHVSVSIMMHKQTNHHHQKR
jgi:hypothetical protein